MIYGIPKEDINGAPATDSQYVSRITTKNENIYSKQKEIIQCGWMS